MKKKYGLCLLANDDVFEDLYICIKSFIKNNIIDVDIIILYDDKYCIFSDENKEKVKKLKSNIFFHKVDTREYEEIFEKWKENKVDWYFYPVFYKFECFGMSQYDTVVVMDTDIVVLRDISKLWTRNDGDIYAVVDKEDKDLSYFVLTNDIKNYQENNYFNVGVLSIGKPFLNKREEILLYTINFPIGVYAKLPYKLSGIYPEQDVLNMYLRREHKGKLLPYKYNAMVWLISRFNCGEDYLRDVKILHYACQLNKEENCTMPLEKELFKIRSSFK